MLLSSIDPQEINLREGEMKSIKCPDCRTWRRLMGDTTLKIREHCISDKVADGEKHVRCDGSNQVVVLDISVEQWSEAVLAADSTATGRRSGRVIRKPRASVPTPVHRLGSMPGPSTRLISARTQARNAVNRHRSECGVCRTGRARCTVGRELEIRMGHTDATVRLANEQRESALRAAAAPTIPRTQQWRRVVKDVNRVDDARRALVPAAAALTGALGVPLAPQDVEAHERRQAELGSQYALRNTASTAARGEMAGPAAVESALMDGHVRASGNDGQD
ncbi:hypothetical protein OQI_06110 [Streptomyces pharetrae CZA14]|uniref:Uncharacterized protein n=2 Tax=Streptomyces pharetrae TaxID=291370 RepID=A0ABX3YPA3_9ACTN|nr:hypothetical protein OQI_06110 [Streptomyces pharetrae CZA14]